ncbi:SecY-interacting protein [Pseudoalteromonas denitrificans]|uniref:Protein Syd n=1 Tax=Pseudoalteromonas denitrificans DSM 6059 TaxID=1123010 RepID=A0A1I1MRE5_9GAMM|nr:SecY-interacting protein [Pseudoalteromonas denitrificans]SFC87929.1 SecY interacting protein Syd [Pseudoalteromonas denitrificans DSM 6059]
MSIYKKLQNLFEQYQTQAKQHTNKGPLVVHDTQWPSPCELTDTLVDGKVQWQAVEQKPQRTMENLATALDLPFGSAISEYYGSFYADNITVTSPWGKLVLLQAWSDTDYDQLQQNITGHILMKQKLKQDETVFIALTEQDDLLITIENTTGFVWLEYVGKKPHEKIANSIEAFLEQVEAGFNA